MIVPAVLNVHSKLVRFTSLYNLDRGLQCTKVRKCNSTSCGVLFVVIPYQLIGLQNVSLFERNTSS